MTLSRPQLKVEALAPHFAQLLQEAGCTLDQPEFFATWKAFAALALEPVDCDDEKLLFEVDISPKRTDTLYVHFARTSYGREPKGHQWSHEVICDFLYPLDEVLELISFTIEAEELTAELEPRDAFVRQVEGKAKLWNALRERQPLESSIYIGES